MLSYFYYQRVEWSEKGQYSPHPPPLISILPMSAATYLQPVLLRLNPDPENLSGEGICVKVVVE